MTTKYYTRMGDGRRVEMTKEELRKEIEDGANNGATKGKVPGLTEDELDHLLEIFCSPERVVSVRPEDLIVMSTDVAPDTILMNYSEYGGVGVPTDTVTANIIAERVTGLDCVQNAFRGGNAKGTSVSAIQIQQETEALLMNSINPLFYVCMPNFGAYYKPDGPFDNCGDLMAAGKIEEARKTYEAIIPSSIRDLTFIAKNAASVGADAINIDTAAAAGDAEFLGVLKATEKIKEETEMGVAINMANHFVLGMHGEVQYDGKTLAGMMPHDQAKVVEKSGATIFGPVVNTNTKKSVAWTVSKTVTVMKECSKQSNIPIHPNLGMGVCGAPMAEIPPIDAVSRAAKALVEIGRADGIQCGLGDPVGFLITNEMSVGMHGIRTAGDLVMRMQLKGMRLKEAKEYVARKLGTDVFTLSDEYAMKEIREELGIGTINAVPGQPKGLKAKAKIAELLDIKIPCVELLR